MALNNSLTRGTQNGDEGKLSLFLQKEAVKAKITTALGSEKDASLFMANLTSAVSNNVNLQECTNASLVSSALMAAALKLPITSSLGFVHLVPFKDTKNNTTIATFILGYKGYIQLAIRSGFYKHIIVLPIKQGELQHYNPMTEEISVNLIADDTERENTPDMGYYAMFELINGFTKSIYWSKEKMLAHADRYSKAFSLNGTGGKYPKVSYADYVAGKVPKGDEWKYSSNWYQDFAGMAQKTLIRALISKWGIMSIEMQNAYEEDTKNIEINDNGAFDAEPPAKKAQKAKDDFFDDVPHEELAEEKPKAEKKKAKGLEEADDVDDDFLGGNPFAGAIE